MAPCRRLLEKMSLSKGDATATLTGMGVRGGPELVVFLPVPLDPSLMTLTSSSSQAGGEEPLASPCLSLAPKSLSLNVAICKMNSIVCKGIFHPSCWSPSESPWL